MTPLEEILAKIAADEGGVKDVGDGKGVTHYGQTEEWLASYGLPIPQSPKQAMSNWSVWCAKTKLDQLVGDTYDEFAHLMIDYAVHSGSSTAIKALQSFLRVPADGALGPVTLAALKVIGTDRRSLACKVMAHELRWQGRLITKKPVPNASYAQGWNDRNARILERIF